MNQNHFTYQRNPEYIACLLDDCGAKVVDRNSTRVDFIYKYGYCTFYLKKQWLTGKSVKDGRGIKHLIKQISK